DCLPILLYDPVRRVVASIHAGWRGTVLNVAGETVRAMMSHYGVVPDDLIAYLGPAICRSCYEVGDDVRDAWSARPEAASVRAIGALHEMPGRHGCLAPGTRTGHRSPWRNDRSERRLTVSK